MDDDYLLTDEQEKVVRSLERAFRAAASCGLRVRGTNNHLACWNGFAWERCQVPDRQSRKERLLTPVPEALISHAGVYFDSGADDTLYGVPKTSPIKGNQDA